MVGVKGFEPSASASRTQRSTKLSHTPTETIKRLKSKRWCDMKKLHLYYIQILHHCQ